MNRKPFARIAAAVACTVVAQQARAQITGTTTAHDPSTLIKDPSSSKYYYFATGNGITARSSTNSASWSADPSVFGSTIPAWTTASVPGFAGNFWAPDIAYFNGRYNLYYSVSTFGSQDSAIGLVTNATLDRNSPNYAWTDQGSVIESNPGDAYNTIDPSIFQDTNGRVYMTFGSFWNGVYLTELDPATGKRLSPGTAPTRLAAKPGDTQIEASYMFKRDGYYYLFVNWGLCCQGVNSTYNIRVGRSTTPSAFRDKANVLMASGGGSLYLSNVDNKIGPGHMGIFSEGGKDRFSYHYYDANSNGTARYNLQAMYWDAAGWPSATPTGWSGASATGNWSDAANWTGGVPNGGSNYANFANLATVATAVTIDGGAKTIGAINFDTLNSFTIGDPSGNALIFDVVGDNARMNLVSGNHTIAAPVTMNDNVDVTVVPAASTLALTGPLTSVGRTINKFGAGAVNVENLRSAASINVNAGTVGVRSRVNANQTDGSSIFSVLSLATDSGGAPAASFDLGNNSLIVTFTPKATIESYIAAARHGGAWDRNGLTSSAATTSTTLGVLSGAEYTSIGGGTGTFAGLTYVAGNTLVKYTWYGDANFSGTVSFDDYVRIDTGFNTHLTGWANGDFNLDGAVNFDDYVLIDVAFNQQNGTLQRAIDWISADDRSESGTTASGVQTIIDHFEQFGAGYGAAFLAAVPEPSTLVIAGVVASATTLRLRRRR